MAVNFNAVNDSDRSTGQNPLQMIRLPKLVVFDSKSCIAGVVGLGYFEGCYV